MKLGDFLVDLAAVAAASRSVASKHAALRAHQFETFQKSSSVLNQASAVARKQADAAGEPPAPRSAEAPLRGAAAKAPGGFPARREGSLGSPRLGSHVSARAEGVPQGPTAAFRPAPWATPGGSARRVGLGRELDATSTAQAVPEVPCERGAEESLPQGIDLNVFRTAQTARVLTAPRSELAEEPEEKSVAAAREAPGPPPLESEDVGARTEAEGMSVAENPHRDDSGPPREEQSAESGDLLAGPAVLPVQEGSESAAEFVKATATTEQPPAGAPYQLRESKVPASRLSRLWNYGGLAAGMFAGAVGESLSRAVGGGGTGGQGSSMMLSAANMERLVARLSRMRGAALKLGQMMSLQDSGALPGPARDVLQRVQDRADYMPAWQRDGVLAANLGADWRGLFSEFEETPVAAASIGQVHRATLRSSGARVALKIQFPGVASSINSDLDNLGMLLAATRLLPKGLYLDRTIANARTELAWECDYLREAACAERYGALLADDPQQAYAVPRIYPEASGKEVLAMEYMSGTGVVPRGDGNGHESSSHTQQERDWIGTQVLRLCLREITEFRFMQTDPNWTNFLYNRETHRLELLDFGAAREFPARFIAPYVRLLAAASRRDAEAVADLSRTLGYLTGHESRAMVEAHVQSVLTLAEPFADSSAGAPGPGAELYDFRDQTITARVRALIPTMLHERLAPPPEETYSLHRKLSGAFLLCARLGSRVPCRELFRESMKKANLESDE